jgi:hypothetical protein
MMKDDEQTRRDDRHAAGAMAETVNALCDRLAAAMPAECLVAFWYALSDHSLAAWSRASDEVIGRDTHGR